MTNHTPVQIMVAAIPAIAWIAVAVRRTKTFRGAMIAWLAAFAATAFAAVMLIYISN